MHKFKDFFDMSKHERRGTIVVLALIAVMLAASVAVRSCRDTSVASRPSVEQLQFDAATDTATPPATKSVKKEKPPKKARRSKSSPSRSKSSPRKSPKQPPASQPMTPVPQF